MYQLTAFFLLFLFFLFPVDAKENDKVLYLYHDADWVNHVESAQSIWRGVHVALSEVNYQVQGYQLQLLKKNHSGNVARSKANYQSFLKDAQALAVISGIHSPPLIKNRQYINANKALTLVPWAAGGPVTRHPSTENWVFRLSVDDTKAGAVLIKHAIEVKSCASLHLVLENTPWGDSNLKNMRHALAGYDDIIWGVSRFNWGLKKYGAASILIDAKEANSECIIFVGNALEGATIAKAMNAIMPQERMPIISHWGITGGDFHETVPESIRKNIDLSFIQSCFSFMQKPLSKHALRVFNQAKKIFPKEIKTVSDIRSPAGFIHGYDITRLFLSAITQVQLRDDNVVNKNNIRLALENLQQPVTGLVKTYQTPYSQFTKGNLDAHEALGEEDYCMAYYNKKNDIIVLPKL